MVGDGRWKKIESLIKLNNLEDEFKLINSVPLNKNKYFNCATHLFEFKK